MASTSKKARKEPNVKREQNEKYTLPLLPLKDAVIFPHMATPIFVGRSASLAAVEMAASKRTPLFLVLQKDASVDNPKATDLHRVGVFAQIVNVAGLPDGGLKVVVEGLARGKVISYNLEGLPYIVEVSGMPTPASQSVQLKALKQTVLHQFEEYLENSQKMGMDILFTIRSMTDEDQFADTVSAYLPLSLEERQTFLETVPLLKRYKLLVSYLEREIELAQIERDARRRIRKQIERGQREHYLQEQLRLIQSELGMMDESGVDTLELENMIESANMPAEIKKKALRELRRYERLPPMSPDSAVLRGYLEWLCDMPWSKRTRDAINLKKARETLDADHFGLEKVKERILEFLAVRKLNRAGKGPILCLVGPPGVGKTSLGQSIAQAMGRKFVRLSLGGIRDEAEIRGHRRTYVGALPGRLIQGIKDAGVKNPVMMLDEIDKLSADFRGDPSSALLEALDPEQNKHFSDHFLEVGFDLSEVFFITTANNEYNIPLPLQDRMEIVRLPGYTPEEKYEIARLYLQPRQINECGLNKVGLTITEEGMETLIQRYTREAGVRELDRSIASLCRKIARKIVDGETKVITVLDSKEIVALLGPPPYGEIQPETLADIGVAIGMAWTYTGGEVLRIESSVMQGKGALQLTGQLGDVMKESAAAAYTYIRTRAASLGVAAEFYKNTDVHVHIPEGAIPKDGPSAGLAMIVSLLSALRQEAPAPAIAMTGEITLRGRVLAVGGIKEKVIAAYRAGICHVVLPDENEKDFPDLPLEIREKVRFSLVSRVEEALPILFPGIDGTKKSGARRTPPVKEKAAEKKAKG